MLKKWANEQGTVNRSMSDEILLSSKSNDIVENFAHTALYCLSLLVQHLFAPMVAPHFCSYGFNGLVRRLAGAPLGICFPMGSFL